MDIEGYTMDWRDIEVLLHHWYIIVTLRRDSVSMLGLDGDIEQIIKRRNVEKQVVFPRT